MCVLTICVLTVSPCILMQANDEESLFLTIYVLWILEFLFYLLQIFKILIIWLLGKRLWSKRTDPLVFFIISLLLTVSFFCILGDVLSPVFSSNPFTKYVVMTLFSLSFFNFQECFCVPCFFFSFLFRMVSCSCSLDAVSITSWRLFVWSSLPISSLFPLISCFLLFVSY